MVVKKLGLEPLYLRCDDMIVAALLCNNTRNAQELLFPSLHVIVANLIDIQATRHGR